MLELIPFTKDESLVCVFLGSRGKWFVLEQIARVVFGWDGGVLKRKIIFNQYTTRNKYRIKKFSERHLMQQLKAVRMLGPEATYVYLISLPSLSAFLRSYSKRVSLFTRLYDTLHRLESGNGLEGSKNRKRTLTAADKKQVAALQGWKCSWCNNVLPARFEVDHIEQFAQGGSDDFENLQALCPNCHATKTDKDRQTTRKQHLHDYQPIINGPSKIPNLSSFAFNPSATPRSCIQKLRNPSRSAKNKSKKSIESQSQPINDKDEIDYAQESLSQPSTFDFTEIDSYSTRDVDDRYVRTNRSNEILNVICISSDDDLNQMKMKNYSSRRSLRKSKSNRNSAFDLVPDKNVASRGSISNYFNHSTIENDSQNQSNVRNGLSKIIHMINHKKRSLNNNNHENIKISADSASPPKKQKNDNFLSTPRNSIESKNNSFSDKEDCPNTRSPFFTPSDPKSRYLSQLRKKQSLSRGISVQRL